MKWKIIEIISVAITILALTLLFRFSLAFGATQAEIRTIIVEEAKKHGVSTYLALELALIESGYNPTIKNPTTSATGLYQFTTGTFRSLCEGNRLDPRDNARCAMKLLSGGHLHHWTCDIRTKIKLEKAGIL